MNSETRRYPRRLIEVDLPIKEISEHARREKSIRHGHISTLHVWWARRPLAACRAVIAAALWLDPADAQVTDKYRSAVFRVLRQFAQMALDDRATFRLLPARSISGWKEFSQASDDSCPDAFKLRSLLLEIVALASNWEAMVSPVVRTLLKELTAASNAEARPEATDPPRVIDPFAGGGAMPLEALRLGADAVASDLNPVAVLLNRVILEYAPAGNGAELAEEVRTWGAWISECVKVLVDRYYPPDPDGAKPLAYIWSRTIQCEGPNCGKLVPLVSSFWLTKRSSGSVALQLNLPAGESVPKYKILQDPQPKEVSGPTVRRGSAVCPWCEFMTPVSRVRTQLSKAYGGADSSQLLAVVVEDPSGRRRYRAPQLHDLEAVVAAREKVSELRKMEPDRFPFEPLPPKGTLGFRVQNYGMSRFEHIYTARQLLTLSYVAEAIRQVEQETGSERTSATLSLALGRLQDLNTSLSRWADTVIGANAGQNRLSMTWDFAEAAPFAGAGGGWSGQVDWICRVLANISETVERSGAAMQAPAQLHPFPDNGAQLLATDPPYYDAFGYADLSDLFLVWLKRAALRPRERFPELELDGKAPKRLEIVVNPSAASDGRGAKDHDWFYTQMRDAFSEARRIVAPSGLGVIVFAHKETKSWEALLSGVVQAGWIVTGSWPIDTERPNRQRALGSAALASSVHLVCRPRESSSGELEEDAGGDWKEVLEALPERIHEWLPRLAAEGIVGADAIFACLGPALEIFSRYSFVERASGSRVSLGEYLEHVWAAVAREALSMIFENADVAGFEEDARLTAMWLWTLCAANDEASALGSKNATAVAGAKPVSGASSAELAALGGGTSYLTLEYDAARKISQALGVNLDTVDKLVVVEGNEARLLSVRERARWLIQDSGQDISPVKTGRVPSDGQLPLFQGEQSSAATASFEEYRAIERGDSVLDRLHQAMILFGGFSGAVVKRFLVEEVGERETDFWRLAQSLSALYPRGTDEKRWVDGVLGYKKRLGL